MGNIKIEKLAMRIKERAGEILLHEMNDPRFGFVTVTKVRLSRDLRHCAIYYSVLGAAGDRSRIAHALEHARGYIQRRIAEVLRTRATPAIEFRFDESVEGSVRVSKLIDELSRERDQAPEDGGGSPPRGDPGDPSPGSAG